MLAPTVQSDDVVIVGGGFAGLALAALLGRAWGSGARITVVDPVFGRVAAPDPNSSAIAAGPRHLLETIGVWADVAASAGTVSSMSVTDSRLEDVLRPVWLDFGDADGKAEPIAHIVPNDLLREALIASAQEAGARLVTDRFLGFGRKPSAIEIRLSSGMMLAAPVLVAADGAGSQVRDAARIRTHGWRYGQSSIVTRARLNQPHGGVAVQHFLTGGPLALLPLPEAQVAVVWTQPSGEARRLMALDDAAFSRALSEASGQEIVPQGPKAVRPLGLQIARSFFTDRVALIGDAAHAVHPLAGQGLNLGFKDVAALGELLIEAAREGRDPGEASVLEAYSRWRRFDSLAMVGATDALARLFRGDRLRIMRGIGLGSFDRLPSLKAGLMKAAAGEGRNSPKLLHGEMP